MVSSAHGLIERQYRAFLENQTKALEFAQELADIALYQETRQNPLEYSHYTIKQSSEPGSQRGATTLDYSMIHISNVLGLDRNLKMAAPINNGRAALAQEPSREPQKDKKFKRKAVHVVINGEKYLARPDSGSDKDIMSEEFAQKNCFSIHRKDSDKRLFEMGNGKYIRSMGRAFVTCCLSGSGQPPEGRWFHVLESFVEPLVIGMEYLQKSQLYTKFKYLLVEGRNSFPRIPTLKYMGSPKGRIHFNADKQAMAGCPDTGSDLDLMSPGCAARRGFKIDQSTSARTKVLLPDQTVVYTIGQVKGLPINIEGFHRFEMDFHILPGLPCDVIFAEEFLEKTDAFNTCCRIEDNNDDPYAHSLNTLINLGPIQAFLSRLWKPKAQDTAQQEHDDELEAEQYRRYRESRAISKIQDHQRALVAKDAAALKAVTFDRRHANCIHCIGRYPGGTSADTSVS